MFYNKFSFQETKKHVIFFATWKGKSRSQILKVAQSKNKSGASLPSGNSAFSVIVAAFLWKAKYSKNMVERYRFNIVPWTCCFSDIKGAYHTDISSNNHQDIFLGVIHSVRLHRFFEKLTFLTHPLICWQIPKDSLKLLC